MSYAQKAWQNLKSLFQVYLLGITFFAAFRLLLVLLNVSELKYITNHKWLLLGEAFLMGLRFDTVIACYIMALPVFLTTVFFLLKRFPVFVLRVIYFFIGLLFIGAFVICCFDIPFFNHFFSRLNNTIFNWNGHAAWGIKMIFQDPKYFGFFFVLGGFSTVFLYVLRKIRKRHQQYLPTPADEVRKKHYFVFGPSILLLFGFVFLGIRGRAEEKSPIIPGTAYFSDYPFINQLGLNPVFTLMRSWLDSQNPENKELHWLKESDALTTMHRLLHGDPMLQHVSPIARMQHTQPVFKGRNVVVVIMESMSAAKMGRFGNPDNMTPFLDSLATQCWSFDSIFSAGMHTYNGIYTTLFAHPALMKKHTMDHVTVPRMAGFPNILDKLGYQTNFFTTHDELFDNMSGFMLANEVKTVYGQKDYPSAEIKSTLGVTDEYLFKYAVPKLSADAAKGPFFAALMTASDHDPFVVPTDQGFTPHNTDKSKQIVEYADWSIRKFIEFASKEPWFNNTVFVFVADHGGYIGPNAYDVAFSYHHIPFLVFAPGPNGTQPRAIKTLGLQADVFPTVASQVIPDFINNTFGINLLQDKRPYIVFSSDDKLSCMNDSLLYIYREEADAGLYRYRNNDVKDISAQYPKLVDSMRHVAFAWLQTSQWMINNGKTR